MRRLPISEHLLPTERALVDLAGQAEQSEPPGIYAYEAAKALDLQPGVGGIYKALHRLATAGYLIKQEPAIEGPEAVVRRRYTLGAKGAELLVPSLGDRPEATQSE